MHMALNSNHRPKPAPVVHLAVQPAPEPVDDITAKCNTIVPLIRERLTYQTDWKEEQITRSLMFLVKSLIMKKCKDKFPVKLSDLSELLRYNQIRDLKLLMEANCKENKDYRLLVSEHRQNQGRGGHNRQEYELTVSCAKRLCMLSNTTIAKHFRMYFVMVEDLFLDAIENPNDNIAQLLGELIKPKAPLSIEPSTGLVDRIKDAERARDAYGTYTGKTVIYIFRVCHDEFIYKFGMTNNIREREKSLTRKFGNRIALVKIFDIDWCASRARAIELDISAMCKDFNIQYSHMGSTETFKLNKLVDIDEIVSHVYRLIPKPSVPINNETRKEEDILLEYIMHNPPLPSTPARVYKAQIYKTFRRKFNPLLICDYLLELGHEMTAEQMVKYV